MFVAVEDVVDEAVDDGGLAHCLVSQEHDFVFKERGDGPLREIQIANIRSHLKIINRKYP
jgi:hypothetical protein